MILIAVQSRAGDGRDVERARHVLDDRVEHFLDTAVAVGAAAADRDGRAQTAALAEGRLELLHGRLLAFKIQLHQLLVEVADLLHELVVPLLGLVGKLGRDIDNLHIVALLVFIIVCLHIEKVDKSHEISFLANRYLKANRIFSKACADLVHRAEEIRANDIHLVDKCHTGDIVFVRLAPDVLGLGLHATLGIKYADRAIQDAKRPFDLHGEIHVTGSIDDVDAMLLGTRLGLPVLLQRPVAGGRSRGDGDTPLLLLLHPVHGRRTFVGITDLVVDTGIVENALRQRRLAGVDVGHDTDVPGSIQGIISSSSSHVFKTSLNMMHTGV